MKTEYQFEWFTSDEEPKEFATIFIAFDCGATEYSIREGYYADGKWYVPVIFAILSKEEVAGWTYNSLDFPKEMMDTHAGKIVRFDGEKILKGTTKYGNLS